VIENIRVLEAKDLADMSRLMGLSWAADYDEKGYVGYEPEILMRQFETEKDSVWLGSYRGGELVGVNVSFPRKIMIEGNEVEAVIPTYLSVDPPFRRKGIATALVKGIVERNRNTGKKLILPYFDDEGKGKKVYERYYPEMRLILKGSWLGKILDPDTFSEKIGYDVPARKLTGGKLGMECLGPGNKLFSSFLNRTLNAISPTPEQYGKEAIIGPSNVEEAFRLTKPRFSWDRAWSRDELSIEIADPHSITSGYRVGGVLKSVMHFKIRKLVSRGSITLAWFDWLYGRKGIRDMLRDALAMAREKGAVLALVPRMGYFSTIPFMKAGFVPFPKRFELHAIGIGGYEPPSVRKIRLDVR